MLGEFKAIAAALLLPPASPLLLAAAGLLCVRRAISQVLIALGLLALWLLSCNGTAVWLAQRALPQVGVLEPSRQVQLRASGVQAIVILGGGIQGFTANELMRRTGLSKGALFHHFDAHFFNVFARTIHQLRKKIIEV